MLALLCVQLCSRRHSSPLEHKVSFEGIRLQHSPDHAAHYGTRYIRHC